MPTIKFSDTELEYLRESYQAELKAAMKYVEEIRQIVAKLGGGDELSPEPRKKSSHKPEKKKKRGRPRVIRADKAEVDDSKPLVEKKKRGRPRQEKNVEQNQKEVNVAKAAQEVPKKKAGKRKKPSGKWGGVRLANLSKPLKKTAPVEKKETSVGTLFTRTDTMMDKQ